MQSFRRVPHSLHQFTDYLYRLPGAARPGRIAGEFLICHGWVVLSGVRRFHNLDPPKAFACGQFSAPC